MNLILNFSVTHVFMSIFNVLSEELLHSITLAS